VSVRGGAWASAAASLLLVSAVACRQQAPRPPRWSGPPPYVPAPVIHPGEAPPPVVEPPPVEPPPVVPVVEPQPRRFATVHLVGVRMGLGRSDGTAWDFDMGTAPQKEDVRAITAILEKESTSAQKISAIKEVFGRPTAKVVSKPDVQGSAALLVDGVVTTTVTLPLVSDTLTPEWKKIAWKKVPVDATGKLRVMLVENDWKAAEPVEPFEINHAHVSAALETPGKPHSVLVADQTDREVLIVTFTATPE
jgi:hypothetical protein